MVERGIIKVYFGSQSHNKGRYGFIRVIDEKGKFTGEEVFFHLNRARQPRLVGTAIDGSSAVAFSDVDTNTAYLYGQPRKGDVVVFTAEPTSPKRRVVAWTMQDVWDEFSYELSLSDEDELYASELAKKQQEDCSGGCGQPSYACTCIELASFQGHNNVTDGYWTA